MAPIAPERLSTASTPATTPTRTRSSLYEREVKDLTDAELLNSTFTMEDLERGRGTWSRGKDCYPTCVFCGLKYRGYDSFTTRCHIDGNLTQETTGKVRPVRECNPDHEHKVRHQEILDELRARRKDVAKKMVEESRFAKRQKLMETAGEGTEASPMDVELMGTETHHSCGLSGDVVTREDMDKAWSEAIVGCGLPPSIVDHPTFREAVLKTSRCGSQAVSSKSAGVYKTTLPHSKTFKTKLIPALDEEVDKDIMGKLKPIMKDVGATVISDGWTSTSNRPIVNVILGINSFGHTLRKAVDTSGEEKNMEYIAKLVCEVIEDVGPTNVVAVCMDGACKGAFDHIQKKYPWMQCYPCPSHGIDLFLKNVGTDKEEIQMQANRVGGVGRQEVEWDEPFFKDAFDDAWFCIQAVCAHQKSLAEGTGLGRTW
jgi:hypothetical protein